MNTRGREKLALGCWFDSFPEYREAVESDPAFRRKERKRLRYGQRYNTDPAFWSNERRRCNQRYRDNPEVRRQALERCRKCREKARARREQLIAEIREFGRRKLREDIDKLTAIVYQSRYNRPEWLSEFIACLESLDRPSRLAGYIEFWSFVESGMDDLEFAAASIAWRKAERDAESILKKLMDELSEIEQSHT